MVIFIFIITQLLADAHLSPNPPTHVTDITDICGHELHSWQFAWKEATLGSTLIRNFRNLEKSLCKFNAKILLLVVDTKNSKKTIKNEIKQFITIQAQ